MKKLALASAIALISAGANAQIAATGTILVPNSPGPDLDITVPCASTWAGGADGFAFNVGPSTVSGTICLDPTGTGNPYVMVGVSMSDSGTVLTMDRGALQVALGWTTGGWAAYNVINVPTNPISCSVKLTCAATLFSNPATFIIAR